MCERDTHVLVWVNHVNDSIVTTLCVSQDGHTTTTSYQLEVGALFKRQRLSTIQRDDSAQIKCKGMPGIRAASTHTTHHCPAAITVDVAAAADKLSLLQSPVTHIHNTLRA